jgi:hypothetical protein
MHQSTFVSYVSTTFMTSSAGSEHMCDMDRLTVLLHIPRLIDLCGDVPIQLIMFLLCGHDGSTDARGSQEDVFWKIRDQLYDTITPDEIREKARLERIALRVDGSAAVSMKVLSIVANGNGAVLESLQNRMLAAKTQKELQRHDALEGLPSDQVHGEDDTALMPQDHPMNDSSDVDSIEDALGLVA